ncbi:MAG TPA: DUF1236 domain-containing protein [Xanthobacteraceae bacterium]|nr:DUF1236 domain-containing protein [Xanthobacteraceae bacterium]
MKQIIGVVAAVVIAAAAYVYIQQRPEEPSGPTGYRANQPSGGSTAGVSQQMPRREARDSAGVDETGARASAITETATDTAPLSAEQRRKIASYFAGREANAVDPAYVSLTIGAAIPRQIALQPLPPEVVGIMQKYRGDSYVMTAGKLVIVEPKARRIVAIIPMA